MAEVQPLRALHYDLGAAGPLSDLIAPPYDVIGSGQRAGLAARSPYNVVHVDLPEGDDPYTSAAELLGRWLREGIVVRDDRPAVWALTQDYVAPGGARMTRRGFLCRVRVEDYGAGRIRPHERTHPGPLEDRLALTRATRVNLSPIFALHPDPDGSARGVLTTIVADDPWGEASDDEGTIHRVWRVADSEAIAALQSSLAGAELLIADGHHRYETARAYAQEVGGEGPHRYVLMCLVALEDPGVAVFPIHRLVAGLGPQRREALAAALRRDFDLHEVAREALVPDGGGPLRLGYLDAQLGRPLQLALRDQSIADSALPDKPPVYRRLDTAVLEALVLKGALGMTEADIAHLNGLGYSVDASEALRLLDEGAFDAGFFMRPTPVAQVREVAAAGETMPPKSTFFYPKLATGLVFNPLSD
ncbi:MAG TPA: DUF1015 domain-containing protein [Solirubrobacteraceae bacterium]|nr:DUF1015 domain-containing protein [Solirubrobacteraceae bacterium]